MHSVWLMPSAASAARFHQSMALLSSKLPGPIFQPHITLLGDLSIEAGALINKTAESVSGLAVGRARVAGVDGQESYFKSLFLDVVLPERFEIARAELAQSLNLLTFDQFRPHISLAYGAISNEYKRNLIDEIASDIAGYEFELAAIEIVESANTIPVENWRTKWRYDLVTQFCHGGIS